MVCHPHPLHGGTLHTHAVHRIARAARSRGCSTLRFNFRGVGRSQGRHDGGRGERDDVRAALGWAGERAPGLPQLLAGFSFGAWMAVEVGSLEPQVKGVLAVGLPVGFLELEGARACPRPLAAIQGERDEFAGPERVAALLEGSVAARRQAVVPGASHLFVEALVALEHEAGSAFDWLLGGGA